MRATFTQSGKLVLMPETRLEHYTIKKWMQENSAVKIIIEDFMYMTDKNYEKGQENDTGI